MKKSIIAFSIATFFVSISPIKADFGDDTFKIDRYSNSPQTYHDGWCRFINSKCRIRFQGYKMWVEGQGGIYVSQFVNYRYETDKGAGHNIVVGNRGDYYNYITYKTKKSRLKEALFTFKYFKDQKAFSKAFIRWAEQDQSPTIDVDIPFKQAPLNTQENK